MKILVLIFLAIPCFAQEELREFGIAEVFRSGDSIFIKRLVTKVINVSEGTVTKMRTPPDSARLFIAPDGGIYEGVITWRKVGGPVEPPIGTETIIDGVTRDSRNQYTGTWVHSTSSWTSVFGGTASYSNTPGATLTISFTGNRIQWFSEKSNNKGEAMVSIDGSTEISVPLFATNPTPPNVKSMVYESPELPQGAHTFKIRVVSQSVLHDEVKVFSR